MKDLLPRFLVAVVGIPAVLGLLYVGGWVLAVPLAIFSVLGAGEVYRFAEVRGVRPLSWLGMPVAGLLVLVPVLHPDYPAAAPVLLGLLTGLGFLTLTGALWWRGPKGHPLVAVSVTVFGAGYAGLPFVAAMLLSALPARMEWGGSTPSAWVGGMAVALPLATTWLGDAAAYFLGSTFGRAKLFPSVSPGKSWVGAWAGVAGSILAAVLWYVVVRDALPGFPLDGFGEVAGLGALLGVGAIVGDLAESLLKREAGMKDSGKLLPGHGGILDRLDALTYTIPMAYLVLRFAEALT